MDTKERIMAFAKAKRLSIRQFQDSIEVSGSYVANINKGLGGKVIRKIEEVYPELNIDWLVEGKGEMFKTIEGATQSIPLNKTVIVIPASAQGGRLNEYVTSVCNRDCERMYSPIDGVDYALTVSGDSMEPDYPNGCRVFVKKINEKAFIDWGRVFVLDTCNGAVIKKIFPGSDENHVKCVSINPIYPSFEIEVSSVYNWYRVLGQFTLR